MEYLNILETRTRTPFFQDVYVDGVRVMLILGPTGTGKYQVLWEVEGFDFEQQESTLKQLAVAFGGDPACTDCNRVLRLPGFLNHKYSPAHCVAVEYPCDIRWSPVDFQLDRLVSPSVLPLRGNARQQRSTKHTTSESDWAWVCHELDHGKDAMSLTHELPSRRSDKPNRPTMPNAP